MKFGFLKMHGAGNDFVVLADPDAAFPVGDAALVRRLCAPHAGLVCEGLLVLQRRGAPAGADLRMVFFNPDGSRAGMCGNGLRCAAFAAKLFGFAAGPAVQIATDAGLLAAELLGADPATGRATVRARASEPRDRRPAVRPAGGPARDFFSVDTGVPHAVAFVEDLAAVDVAAEGAAARRAPEFGPAGTNADFAQVLGPHALALRTFERGVEAETAACGTGAVAAAVAAVETGRCETPVAVRVAFGDELRIEAPRGADGVCREVFFTGPAQVVCRGELDTAFFGA